MDEMTLAVRRAAYMAKMQLMVEEHGMAVQAVFPNEGAEGGDRYAFAYTVGLAKAGQPEFIMFGLPHETAHALLNDIGFRALRGEHTFRHGDIVHQLVRDYPVQLIAVRDSWQHLTISNHLFGNPDGALPALQIVFPDEQGRFPWEPGCTMEDYPVLGDLVAARGEEQPFREITLEQIEGPDAQD